MKITQQSTTQHNRNKNPNFGWLPIAKGIVHKPSLCSKKAISVDICLLRQEDEDFMRSIFKKWKRNTQFGQTILNSFFRTNYTAEYLPKKYHFFMVIPSKQEPAELSCSPLSKLKSLITPKPKKQEPLCLGMLAQSGDNFELQFMQTTHEILNKPEYDRLTGAGRMMVYGMSKFVKSLGGTKLEIHATNSKFYERILNRKKIDSNSLNLTQADMVRFIKETQEKYKLQDTTTTLVDEAIQHI